MAWILLLVAGIFEVAWAYAMKQSDGFSRLWPTVVTLVAMTISFFLLAAAMRTIHSARLTPSGPGSVQ